MDFCEKQGCGKPLRLCLSCRTDIIIKKVIGQIALAAVIYVVVSIGLNLLAQGGLTWAMK